MRWIPLHATVPVGKWQSIRHLGLLGLIVDIGGLISLLDAQPLTLRSVELSCLFFAKTDSYHGLLKAMRDTLGWRERVEGERPLVIIHTNPMRQERCKCAEDCVNAYLCGEASNPFDDNIWPGASPPAPLEGILRHRTHPRLGCPNTTITSMVQYSDI